MKFEPTPKSHFVIAPEASGGANRMKQSVDSKEIASPETAAPTLRGQ
jgi:hypothetical protein